MPINIIFNDNTQVAIITSHGIQCAATPSLRLRLELNRCQFSNTIVRLF